MLSCGFNLVCHAWSLWDAIGFWPQVWIGIGLVLLFGGTLWNIGHILKAVAGWPGVGALVAFVVAAATLLAQTRTPAGEAPSPPVERPKEVPKKRSNRFWETLND